MKNFKLLVGAAMVMTSVLGCECPGRPSMGTTPDVIANPTAISFSACPNKDESGRAVTDVFPDLKKLKLSNQGVAADLTFSFTGAGKDLFSIDGTAPTGIERFGELEIPLKFAPSARGDVRADLVVDDNTEDTPDTIVTLIGSGINLPSQPTIETAPQKTDATGFLSCTPESPLSECILEFPDTLMGQTNTMQLKIRNRGCPSLKIKALRIEGATAGTTDGFDIVSPAVRPSEGSPLVLSTADGTEETIVTFSFTATDDGFGASSQSRYATLLIESNDPNYGDGEFAPARISLQANAVKPSIYASPTSCNFTNDQDRCGNSPDRIPSNAKFRVTNDGATPLTISKVSFRSSGLTTSADSRFSISTNIQGQTLQAGASATLEVTEVDQPLLVSDQLEIVADLSGGAAGSGGTLLLSVISGIKPCLSTDPIDTIDFGDPADELTGRRLVIKNDAACGTLILNEVKIEPASQFFTLVDPLIPNNTVINPGGQLETNVQYRRPSTGGQQLGELIIRSNDTDFSPQMKLILQSNASPDTFPTAAITACSAMQLMGDAECAMGGTTSVAYTGMQLGPTRQITLSAANSTDDNMVSEYRFDNANIGAFPLPAGGSANDLAGNGMRANVNKRVLTVPAGVTGTYRFRLTVWDNRGQESANSSLIIINIYP